MYNLGLRGNTGHLSTCLRQRITFLPVQTEQRHVRTETDRDAQRGYLDLSEERKREDDDKITFLHFSCSPHESSLFQSRGG